MKILITRKELTTYAAIVEVDDEEGRQLIDNPSNDRLEQLCPGTSQNWQDADDPQFEVEECKDD